MTVIVGDVFENIGSDNLRESDLNQICHCFIEVSLFPATWHALRARPEALPSLGLCSNPMTRDHLCWICERSKGLRMGQ